MLKVRVIPTLLSNGYGLVKGEGFESWRSVGSLVPALRVFNSRDVDELIILDIAARREGRSCDIDLVRDAAEHCRVPLTIGGGVNSMDDVQQMLAAGADKVVLNTAALRNPSLIDEAARNFGAQCIVISIDVRVHDGKYVCAVESGSSVTERDPVAWAQEVAGRGAGEILVTRVERDGTMGGYDLGLLSAVARSVRVPTIASGGAASYRDMFEAVELAGVSAVAAGALFLFTESTPAEARHYLLEHGVPTRRDVLADKRSSPNQDRYSPRLRS